ncbi:MAG: MBG domain-containing protein [Isosphaeraceae bacterium]
MRSQGPSRCTSRFRNPLLERLEARELLATTFGEFPIRPTGGLALAVAAGADGNLYAVLDSSNVARINPADSSDTSQYPIPTYNGGAGPMVQASDGNLWFWQPNLNQFAYLDPKAGKVTEVPLHLRSGLQVDGLTATPDGKLWFTEYNFGAIASLDLATKAVTEYVIPSTNSQPEGITATADGRIWVAESGKNKVASFDPATQIFTEYATPAQPWGIAAAPDGGIYFTEPVAGSIGVLDPKNGSVQEYSLNVAGAQPRRLIAAADGNIWFTAGTGGRVGFITTSSDHTVVKLATNSVPGDLASTKDGKVWFTGPNKGSVGSAVSSGVTSTVTLPSTSAATASFVTTVPGQNLLFFLQSGANQIGWADPTTHFTTQIAFPTANSGPAKMVYGPDHNLWITEQNANKLAVFDPVNKKFIAEYSTGAGTNPFAITFGADGNPWYTEPGKNRIGTIDRSSNYAASDFPVPAGASPTGIASTADGKIWFTEPDLKKLAWFDPLQTFKVTEVAVPAGSPRAKYLSPGADGKFYITPGYNGGNQVLVFDPAQGTFASFSVPPHPMSGIWGAPSDAVVANDGQVWYTLTGEFGDYNLFGSIDTVSKNVAEFTTTQNLNAVGIGPDRNVWFSGFGTPGNLVVANIDAATAPAKFAIVAGPPANVGSGRTFGVTVEVQTASGARATDYNGSLTVSLATGPGGAALAGPATASVRQGIAFFPGLSLATPGGGYTLKVSDASNNGFAPVTTPAFSVTRSATHLSFDVPPPSKVTAGVPFSVTVKALDDQNNVDPSYDATVVLALALNPGGSKFGGTLSTQAVNGVATFNGLTLDRAQLSYRIDAISYNYAKLNSTGSVFDVTAAPATKLVLTASPPALVTAGAPFALTVSAQDSFGNVDTSFSGSVAVTLANNPSGGSLAGTTTVNASNGVATLSGLSIAKAGDGYTLQVGSGALSPAVTSPFKVKAGAATKLVVTQAAPASVVAGATFTVSVSAVDVYGNVDTDYVTPAVVALTANPAGATLGGQTTFSFASGVAATSNLSLTKAANGYALGVSAGSLPAVAAGSFDVVAAAVSRLVVSSASSTSVSSGSPQTLTVSAQDTFGNVNPGFLGTVAFTSDDPAADLPSSYAYVAADKGNHDFSGVVLRTPGKRTVTATAGPGVKGTLTFDVAAGSTTTTVAALLPSPTYGQGESFTATVAASDGSTPAGSVQFVLDGANLGAPVALVNGKATSPTFTNLSAKAHTVSALYAGSTNLAASASPALSITVAPAALTVRADDATKAYGQPNPSFAVKGTGFAPGESLATLGGALAFAPLPSNPGAGTYAITPSGLTSSNYTITFAPGTFTVSKAVLNVTADPKSRRFAQANPALTFTYSGFAPGETKSVLTGAPTVTTTADAKSRPGAYPIKVAIGTLAAANYDFLLVDGQLRVTAVAPGDFDGTGKTQPAVFRVATAQWYVQTAGKGRLLATYGGTNFLDLPAVGDYNGDGKPDVAVYRPSKSQWFVQGQTLPNFGGPNDVPVPADYDGDGRSEQAVYRPATGEWFVKTAAGSKTLTKFGLAGDVPVPGDYDGDGLAEPAVFRPSTAQWLVRGKAGDYEFARFGATNLADIPVAGDFDGVGHNQAAIFRPKTGQWYVLGPQGSHLLTTFGALNLADYPVESPVGLVRPKGVTGKSVKTSAVAFATASASATPASEAAPSPAAAFRAPVGRRIAFGRAKVATAAEALPAFRAPADGRGRSVGWVSTQRATGPASPRAGGAPTPPARDPAYRDQNPAWRNGAMRRHPPPGATTLRRSSK